VSLEAPGICDAATNSFANFSLSRSVVPKATIINSIIGLAIVAAVAAACGSAAHG
jgi:hypothetical protein